MLESPPAFGGEPMPIASKLREYLEKEGVPFQVISHSPAYTAQEIAAEMHVSGKLVAKAVVMRVGGDLVMAVLPGNHRVDVEKLSLAMGGADCAMATERQMQDRFPGCELGAEPPFGNLYDMPVWASQALTQDEEIVFNCGTHTEAIRMKYADFARLVRPRVADFSVVAGSWRRPSWS